MADQLRHRDDFVPGEALLPGKSHDPRWYQRAVFYEVVVRGFQDSDHDGSGDLRGITERLDRADPHRIDRQSPIRLRGEQQGVVVAPAQHRRPVGFGAGNRHRQTVDRDHPHPAAGRSTLRFRLGFRFGRLGATLEKGIEAPAQSASLAHATALPRNSRARSR